MAGKKTSAMTGVKNKGNVNDAALKARKKRKAKKK